MSRRGATGSDCREDVGIAPRSGSAAVTGDGPSPIAGALDALRRRVVAVDAAALPADEAVGRVLAQDIVLDRPSPPCDVSAMDGYAVRTPLTAGDTLRVLGTAAAGRPAPTMPPGAGAAVRIFTGAPVPEGATAVVQREHFDETPDAVTLRAGAVVHEGMHIRRRAENGAAGETVCSAGIVLGPAQMGAIGACGVTGVRVRRRLHVGALVTGDEVLPASSLPEAWQMRDSNGPSLLGMLGQIPWIESVDCVRVGDDRRRMVEAAAALLERGDALIVTGGVSVGEHDHVPGVLRDLGVETVFHRLPIRPGRPVLGAVDGAGRPILGLPGNPVSVLVTGRLLGVPALGMRAGALAESPRTLVEVDDDAPAPTGLWWFPLVRVGADGRATLVRGRSSGDWIAAARSDGFIETPPGQAARGLRRFQSWRP